MSYNPQIGVEVTFINRGVPMTGIVTKHNPQDRLGRHQGPGVARAALAAGAPGQGRQHVGP